MSILKSCVGRFWTKWQRFKVEAKNRRKYSGIIWSAKKFGNGYACTPFFSCSGTSKKPKKCGVVGVLQKNFFLFFGQHFYNFANLQ